MGNTELRPKKSDHAASFNESLYQDRAPAPAESRAVDSSLVHNEDAADNQAASIHVRECHDSLTIQVDIGYLARRERIRKLNNVLRPGT
jgi:hypothetical protein